MWKARWGNQDRSLILAILDDGVGGVAGDVADGTDLSLGGDIVAKVLGRSGTEAKKVGADTSNVRRSHRGTGDDVLLLSR